MLFIRTGKTDNLDPSLDYFVGRNVAKHIVSGKLHFSVFFNILFHGTEAQRLWSRTSSRLVWESSRRPRWTPLSVFKLSMTHVTLPKDKKVERVVFYASGILTTSTFTVKYSKK